MTTNVFDKARNVLASDSRWSFQLRDGHFSHSPDRNVIPCVDNTGYDKITFDEDSGYLFAGDGQVIEQWKRWVAAPLQCVLPRPPTAQGFAVCITDLKTGEIRFEHGQRISDTDSRFAGTGSEPAYECWKVNRDAERSIVSACSLDVYSGGQVKFLHGRETIHHNLQTATPFSAINALFLTQGMVIYMNENQGQTAIPIDRAAQQDPRIKDLVERVKVGAVSATAPSGFDPVVWTPADHARLDQALEDRAKKRALKAKT